MINETNICKLITKTTDVRGMFLGKADPEQPNAFWVAIGGVVIVYVTELDRKLTARLIELGFMQPGYTFKVPLTEVSEYTLSTPTEVAAETKLYAEVKLKDRPVLLQFVETDDSLYAYQEKLLRCFSDVKDYAIRQKGGVLYVFENGALQGLVFPCMYHNDALLRIAAKQVGATR